HLLDAGGGQADVRGRLAHLGQLRVVSGEGQGEHSSVQHGGAPFWAGGRPPHFSKEAPEVEGQRPAPGSRWVWSTAGNCGYSSRSTEETSSPITADSCLIRQVCFFAEAPAWSVTVHASVSWVIRPPSLRRTCGFSSTMAGASLTSATSTIPK